MRIYGSNETVVIVGDKIGVAFTGAQWMRIREMLAEDNTPFTGPLVVRIPAFISPEMRVGFHFTLDEWKEIQSVVSEDGDVPDEALAEALQKLIRLFEN